MSTSNPRARGRRWWRRRPGRGARVYGVIAVEALRRAEHPPMGPTSGRQPTAMCRARCVGDGPHGEPSAVTILTYARALCSARTAHSGQPVSRESAPAQCTIRTSSTSSKEPSGVADGRQAGEGRQPHAGTCTMTRSCHGSFVGPVAANPPPGRIPADRARYAPTLLTAEPAERRGEHTSAQGCSKPDHYTPSRYDPLMTVSPVKRLAPRAHAHARRAIIAALSHRASTCRS